MNDLGFWSGKKMLFVYQVLIVAGVAMELYIFSLSLHSLSGLNDTYRSLQDVADPTTVALSSAEAVIGQKFNNFFFGAASVCARKLSEISLL